MANIIDYDYLQDKHFEIKRLLDDEPEYETELELRGKLDMIQEMIDFITEE